MNSKTLVRRGGKEKNEREERRVENEMERKGIEGNERSG